MENPYQKFESEILRAVITEYATRENTDCGERVFALNEKIEVVQYQLENGSARIVFDTESESCNVISVSSD